jgi:glutathione S-transferase
MRPKEPAFQDRDFREPTPYVLFYGLFCPFSRQIRLGLQEKKLPHQLREEKIWAPSEAAYAKDPAGMLPILSHGNDSFVGTYPILEYLEETYPQTNLLGKTPGERAEIRRLMDWFNRKFYKEVTVSLFEEKVMKRRLALGEPDSQILRQGRERIHDHLAYIGWLFEGRNWLGGAFSWADLVAASHLSCLDYLGDVPWNKHASAKDWYMRIKSRPSFRPLLKEALGDTPPALHYRLLDF